MASQFEINGQVGIQESVPTPSTDPDDSGYQDDSVTLRPRKRQRRDDSAAGFFASVIGKEI